MEPRGSSSSQKRRGEDPKKDAAATRGQDEAEKMDKVEKSRCHLHKKPKDNCKFCQRHKELVDNVKEEKAALREKFISRLRDGKQGDSGSSRGLEIANKKTYGLPPLLQTHIVESTHFRMMMTLESLDSVLEEIYRFAESVEPYMLNSTTQPSALFCCLYRLLTFGLNGYQLRRLLENRDNTYIRCVGFLFVRFGLSAEQVWQWLGEYVLDEEELRPSKHSDVVTTVGEYVEGLLTQERYYTTVLPRFPVSTKRKLEEKLAQVPQFRKRARANRRHLDRLREPGVRIEACLNEGDWMRGEVLELHESQSSRIKLRVKLEGGEEEEVQLGKVILAEGGRRSRKQSSQSRSRSSSRGGARKRRSRSRSPQTLIDWSREKGKSTTQLLEELRRQEQDRAVCASGKEYARRAVTVNFAIPMAHGSASQKMAQEDKAAVPTTKRRDRSRSPDQLAAARSKELSAEHQARMKAVFEKYGMAAKTSEDVRKRNDIEGPDIMRLG